MAALHTTRAAASSTRHARQPHRAAPPAQAQAPAAAHSSPLSVFLTNLQLLDLDLLPDWPDISPTTFATSGPGVKRRVQCVEWALFRLFSLWDPQEAANAKLPKPPPPSHRKLPADPSCPQKLKPFFPPLDQMQSLNLRAALLRALENAKKNGVLGRDSVIRKTMLDECKGERLDEVLAYLSTAVLKRVVANNAQRLGRHSALATELVLEDRGYQGNNSELVALVVAHNFSLRRFLERKQVARARYEDFAHLLGIKERAVARRSDMIRHLEQRAGGAAVSENTTAETRRTLRTNWSGSEGWMNALLRGSETGSRGLVAEPFDRVWRRVQQGRLAELDQSGGDLLEQLDSRVRMQRERLNKWDAFRTESFRHKPRQTPSEAQVQRETSSAKGLDLEFVHHQDLQVRGPATRISSIGRGTLPLTDEYASIVNGLQDELTEIRTRRAAAGPLLTRPRIHPPDADDQGSISEMSDMDDDGEAHLANKPPGDHASTNLEALKSSSDAQDAHNLFIKKPDLPEIVTSVGHLFDHDMHAFPPVDRKNLWEASATPSPSPRPSPLRQAAASPPQDPSTDTRRTLSPTQELANQILESMNNASPSPNKRAKPRHTLSLAQRTRLSMARTDYPFLQGDEPESPPEPAPVDQVTATPSLTVVNGTVSADDGGFEDLVSRTRRSMAGFEKAKHKAQLERRRSQRNPRAPPRKDGSLFPAVEEEGGLEAEDPVCEEDMEAVFRSRPKIKASPIPSPTRDLSQDSYE